MLKKLITEYGLDKVNSFTKYPSIPLLHTFIHEDTRITDLTDMKASEKIDGQNVRVLMWDNEFIIGSRENLLWHSDGTTFHESNKLIVDYMAPIAKGWRWASTFDHSKFVVVYGELYGGPISANSRKEYGQSTFDLKLFDATYIDDLSILSEPLVISKWRESVGPNFMTRKELIALELHDVVPSVDFSVQSLDYNSVYEAMKKALPKTLVTTSDKALGRPEGLVLRNDDCSKICKLRFEDYERALR